MKLSTKGRYAIIALTDLAIAKGGDLTSLAEISKRQDISLPYLVQLFVRLRRAGASGGISGSRAQTLSNRLWESLSAHVYVFLHNHTLADVAKNQLLPCPALPKILNVVDD